MGDVEVVADPGNALRAVVRWSTGAQATSRVEFGLAGELQYALYDDAAAADHEVVLYGLRPSSSYTLVAVSTGEDGAELRSDPLTWQTDALPFHGPTFELTALDDALVQPGWTLTSAVVDGILSPTIALAVDLEGEVVWYHEMGAQPAFVDVDVTLTAAGNVLIGGDLGPEVAPVEVSFAGDVAWTGPPQPDEYLAPGTSHHTFRELPNGDHLTLVFDERGGVVTDVVEQRSRDGEVVWSWDASDHVPDAAEEHIHGNMVLVDLEEDVAWFNSLINGALYKLDRADGSLLWALGEEGDFTFVGEHDVPWFTHTHAPELQPDGTVLLYDNGMYPERPWSRAIQYALDEEAMTASVVWEYPGELADDTWFASFWGDADRLDNGNTLITAGTVLDFDTQSTLFEVTEDGAKAWQLYVSSMTEGELAGCYGAERIPVPLEEL